MIVFQIVVVAITLALAGAILFVAFGATRRVESPGRNRRIAGNLLIGLVSLIFIGSGLAKLAQLSPVVAEMESLHMIGWKLSLVGGLELATGLLFLVRALRSFGLLVMSAYLGGAICAHLASDQYFAVLPGVLFMELCWLGAALRDPPVLWSLWRYAASRSAGTV